MADDRELSKYLVRTASGGYAPNPLLNHVYPFWLGLDFNSAGNLPFSVAAAGSNTKPSVFIPPNNAGFGMKTSPHGTPIEISRIIFADSTAPTASAEFTLMLKSDSYRDYMNQPNHIRAIAGTAKNPFFLPEPMFLESQNQISAQFAKLTGGAVNIWPYMQGIQYTPNAMRSGAERDYINKRIAKWIERKRYVTPFFLTTDSTVSLTALSTTNVNTKISDAHFEVFGITAISDGNFNFELTEVVSGQTIMNGAISKTNSLGDAKFPTQFPLSYLLPMGSRLRFTFEDLSNANNNIFITLYGRKIFAPLKDIPAVLRDTNVGDLIITDADRYNERPMQKFGVLSA